jgi:hypothetical protein
MSRLAGSNRECIDLMTGDVGFRYTLNRCVSRIGATIRS